LYQKPDEKEIEIQNRKTTISLDNGDLIKYLKAHGFTLDKNPQSYKIASCSIENQDKYFKLGKYKKQSTFFFMNTFL
jgi:Zn-finger nucleic acid-binding protein